MGMTGVEQARPRVAPFAVPEQRAGSASPSERSRGEHTHSEPPAPRVPVVRTSVRGQVLDALRAALLSGELVPGEVYSAPVLGERFGVSATPVREAMQLLAREGAVEVVPNRGFRVAERSARELAELAEVRALIEVPVVLRLARAVPVSRWASLRPAAEETVAAAVCGDVARYAEVDRAFHRAVLGLAGNEELVRVADDLRRRVVWSACDLAVDAGHHVLLLDALEAQDAPALQAVLNAHFHTP
ncbi:MULTISPECIES: GntR family transcriptional regulator [unclassified Streptomyces]|uniref:GntR family transcriptional regulator n=1 Tax=unclassified Streptomyces TaxID=2593676 RepID=UPI000DB924A1|nr:MULTISPECIES: GntR family transcriptional regulator [unclassified Streptomyces]MYT73876.1 FCD domain-containing protein [Streptomyces sp. SID8367]RAJ89289.1 DNA-binding GntR family transcriptional regulator [Streptomyces sp. PsTaAH-137]